jgi:hypothetical protein
MGAKLKTTPTTTTVSAFLASIADSDRRRECRTLLALMRRATGKSPVMWAGGIVGFGSYHYRYASGREGDWFLTGFAPRKRDLTIYVMAGFGRYEALMKQLGPHTTGVSCLYVKRLADIDLAVLEELVGASAQHVQRTYG